jgi:uncharacterized OsmC-like protein
MKNVHVSEMSPLGSKFSGGYICSVNTGLHRFLTDKRIDEGGEGAAASPKDLLLASLGTLCSRQPVLSIICIDRYLI